MTDIVDVHVRFLVCGGIGLAMLMSHIFPKWFVMLYASMLITASWAMDAGWLK